MKKALNIIKSVLVWMLVAVSVFMMIFTIVSVTTFNRNDRDLFGYRAYTVLSDSMKDTFPAGSIVFMKSVDRPEHPQGRGRNLLHFAEHGKLR